MKSSVLSRNSNTHFRSIDLYGGSILGGPVEEIGKENLARVATKLGRDSVPLVQLN